MSSASLVKPAVDSGCCDQQNALPTFVHRGSVADSPFVRHYWACFVKVLISLSLNNVQRLGSAARPEFLASQFLVLAVKPRSETICEKSYLICRYMYYSTFESFVSSQSETKDETLFPGSLLQSLPTENKGFSWVARTWHTECNQVCGDYRLSDGTSKHEEA
jgi:hypothetical protein